MNMIRFFIVKAALIFLLRRNLVPRYTFRHETVADPDSNLCNFQNGLEIYHQNVKRFVHYVNAIADGNEQSGTVLNNEMYIGGISRSELIN
uniref:Uncharacterized protein n=1 Tax=Romanomermis culicivorax TaxID=13658 RepID=A0A915JCM5_ROMCU